MKKDFVVNKLREVIISGYFRPGESLSEREIAEMLGVSRTPVREAFQRLKLEGIVAYTPKKGMMIPTFDTEQLKQIYSVREHIEGCAARLLAEKADKQTIIAAMRENIELASTADDPKKQAVINGNFHQLMAEGTENQYLINIYQTLRSNISLIRSTSLSYSNRVKTNLKEHIHICDAIESGDVNLAEQVTRSHIRNSMTSAFSLLELERQTNQFKLEN
ncbi:GntR family transcriptional regulator [Caldibacillus lycopersici]|uniref:GntR family transcriptional regulator n=1 Tax=Perspicuibacillus lycopersici TaxID=1325689 RepID=A0AAE3IUT7_9BACI|nr:GntR family transcriptional regulator [Perspicuibacillus lycopersici]MCU9614926.1 GntR family transcriptional regulator [Perspicuibacillus lycopersici]